MDNLSLLTNVSIAALLIIVGYLLARQALPILDRMATALTQHLASMDKSQAETKDAIVQIKALLEVIQQKQGRDAGTQRSRYRRPPPDANDEY
jgi:hypothetical protein